MAFRGWLGRGCGYLHRKWAIFRQICARWNVQISSLLINFILVAMVFFSVGLIILAASQVQISVNENASGPGIRLSDWILSLVVEERELVALRPQRKAELAGIIVAAVGAIVTGVFAVVAWLLAHVGSNDRARKAVIVTLPIYERGGVGDVRVMMGEYKDANDIIVFGGDFSWMKDRSDDKVFSDMRELVADLNSSGKIRFVSYKDAATVIGSIGQDMCLQLQSAITYNPGLRGLRASLITNPYGRVLIYKVHAERDVEHICRVTDRTKDGGQLLDQFVLLINNLKADQRS